MENEKLTQLLEIIDEQIYYIDRKLENLFGDDAVFERLRLYEAKLELQRQLERIAIYKEQSRVVA